MKLIVITPDYATEKNPDRFGFVHARLKEYQNYGFEIKVICTETSIKNLSYIFDNIQVICCHKEELEDLIVKENPDLIVVHFLMANNVAALINKKCLVFIHGYEVVGWYRRLFNKELTYNLLKWNIKQRLLFRYFAKKNKKAKFVFVSNWMKRITFFDIHYKFENFVIIPNYIDTNLFTFKEKDASLRKRILVLRSFISYKYANDITVKVIKKMLNDNKFKEYKFTIYGKGSMFKQLTSSFENNPRVELHNEMIRKELIPDLHRKNGIFLCPTRQDAQGVSMCEAMSSGLVPITTNNTAIPEFVSHKKSGYLCNNNQINSFIKAFEELDNKPELFREISKKASSSIKEKCSYEKTIKKEIELILELINKEI